MESQMGMYCVLRYISLMQLFVYVFISIYDVHRIYIGRYFLGTEKFGVTVYIITYVSE